MVQRVAWLGEAPSTRMAAARAKVAGFLCGAVFLGFLSLSGCVSAPAASTVDSVRGYIRMARADQAALRRAVFDLSDEHAWTIVSNEEHSSLDPQNKSEFVLSTYELRFPDGRTVQLQSILEPQEPLRVVLSGDEDVRSSATKMLGLRLLRASEIARGSTGH